MKIVTGSNITKTILFSITIHKSKVQDYFIKDVNFKNNLKAICNYCKAVYICSKDSITTISKHLKKNHLTKLNLISNKPTIEKFLNTTKVYIKIFLLKFKLTNNNLIYSIFSGPMIQKK